MDTNLFESKRKELGISGAGYDTVTTDKMTWRNKITKEVTLIIPSGSCVHVDFSDKQPGHIYTTFDGNTVKSQAARAHKWLKGFSKEPTLHRLEKWIDDGVCLTPLGHRTEPDGYGPNGEPSWLLIERLI